jgi:putative two-component system hydrogenase maturation factor HypX/HoxX
VFPAEGYDEALRRYCQALAADEEAYYDLLDAKRDRLEEEGEMMERCKEEELARMYPEFWNEQSDFHRLRREFVYKVCPARAPERIARHRK